MYTPSGKSPPPCERWSKVEKRRILSKNRFPINQIKSLAANKKPGIILAIPWPSL
jgi:hypothetical protein